MYKIVKHQELNQIRYPLIREGIKKELYQPLSLTCQALNIADYQKARNECSPRFLKTLSFEDEDGVLQTQEMVHVLGAIAIAKLSPNKRQRKQIEDNVLDALLAANDAQQIIVPHFPRPSVTEYINSQQLIKPMLVTASGNYFNEADYLRSLDQYIRPAYGIGLAGLNLLPPLGLEGHQSRGYLTPTMLANELLERPYELKEHLEFYKAVIKGRSNRKPASYAACVNYLLFEMEYQVHSNDPRLGSYIPTVKGQEYADSNTRLIDSNNYGQTIQIHWRQSILPILAERLRSEYDPGTDLEDDTEPQLF